MLKGGDNMSKSKSNTSSSSFPVVAAFLVVLSILVFMYFSEIVNWLYANEMWYLPFQIK